MWLYEMVLLYGGFKGFKWVLYADWGDVCGLMEDVLGGCL